MKKRVLARPVDDRLPEPHQQQELQHYDERRRVCAPPRRLGQDVHAAQGRRHHRILGRVHGAAQRREEAQVEPRAHQVLQGEAALLHRPGCGQHDQRPTERLQVRLFLMSTVWPGLSFVFQVFPRDEGVPEANLGPGRARDYHD